MTKEELKAHRHNLHALFLRSRLRSDQNTLHECGMLLSLLVEGCEIVDVQDLIENKTHRVFSEYGLPYDVITVEDLKANIKKGESEDEKTGETAEFVSKRKLKEAISKMEELKKEGNSFAECADECIKILREVIT